MTGSGPSSGPALSAGTEREIAELGRRLAPRFVLDGSLGSLFAVEQVLEALRATKRPADEVPWLPAYLGRLLARAWSEIGLPAGAQGPAIRTTDYQVDLPLAVSEILRVPFPFPLAGGRTLAKADARVGPAFTPLWFLGSLLRAQPIGAGGNLRDAAWVAARAVEVRPWIARQHAWFASGNHPSLVGFALRLCEGLAYPPFSHPDDPDGTEALHTVVQTAAMWPDPEAVRAVLRRLLTYQDLFVVAIAARVCLSLEIPPSSAAEASGLLLTLEPGHRDRLWGPVKEALDRFAPDMTGATAPGVEVARQLLAQRRFDDVDRSLWTLAKLDPDAASIRRALLESWFSRRAPVPPPAPAPPPPPPPPEDPSPKKRPPPVAPGPPREIKPQLAPGDSPLAAKRRQEILDRRAAIRAELRGLDDRIQLAEQVGREAAAAQLRDKLVALRKEDEELAGLERLHAPRAGAPDRGAAVPNVQGAIVGVLAGEALPAGGEKAARPEEKRAPSPEGKGAASPAEKAPPAVAPEKGASAKAAPAKAAPDEAAPGKAASKEPTKIGPYEILGLLGEGGMGKVFRVRREDWGMELALKLPRGRVDDRTRARLVRETDAWAALGLHPFVATCYFAMVIDDVPWIFAELVEGGSLADAIEKGSLYEGEPDEVLGRLLDVGWQTALGLHHAHEKGLIHQDMKPGNVLVSKDGKAKVTDFGLARAGVKDDAAAKKRGGNATMMVQFAGMTPAYCSPEQAAASDGAKDARITRRSDLWSWAATLLEVFVGELSWMFGPAAGAALTIYQKEGPRKKRIPRMPPDLVALLELCFAKKEEQRPATLLEVADAIGEIHERALGRPPNRPRVGAYDGADELYNRGTSAMALGDADRALDLWAQALRADPQHAAATFAHAVLRWRLGTISDEEAFRRVDEVRQFAALRAAASAVGGPAGQAAGRIAQAEAEELVAWVHGERGLVGLATERLDAARSLRGGDDEPMAKTLREALAPSVPSVTDVPGEWLSLVGRMAEDGGSFVAAVAGERPRLLSVQPRSGKHVVWHAASAPITALAASAALDVVAFVEAGATRLALPKRSKVLDLEGLPGSSEGVSVAVAPDGRRAAAALGRFVVVWDLDDEGLPAKTHLVPCVEAVHRLQLSELPTMLAHVEGNGGHFLVQLDLDGGVVARAAMPGPVRHVAWSDDGDLAIAAGADAAGRGYLGRWSLAKGAKDPQWLRPEPAPAAALAISSLGDVALTVGPDGARRRWTTTRGRCVVTLDGSGWEEPRGAVLRSDGLAAVVLGANGRARFFPFATKLPSKAFAAVRPTASEELLTRQQTFARKVRDARSALADQRIEDAIATLSEIRAARWSARLPDSRALWSDLADRAHRGPLSAAWPVADVDADRHPVTAVEILPSGDQIWVAREGSRDVVAYDATTGAERRRIAHGAPVRALAISPRGELLATAAGVTLRVEDAAGRSATFELPWEAERLAISGDARRIVVVRGRGVRIVEVRRAPSGGPTLAPGPSAGLTADLHRPAISHDGRVLLLTSEEGLLRFAPDDEDDAPRRLHERDAALDVVWSPAGDVALVGHRSGKLRRMVVGADQDDAVVDVGAPVTGVAASYDMRLALTVDASGAVGVWSLPSPKRLVVLSGHAAEATDVAITPSGRRAVTGGRDGRVRVWNLEWELVAVPEGRVLDARAKGVVERAVAAGAPDAAIRAELAWAGAGHLAEEVVAKAIATARAKR